jgi:hypothetical protein
MNMIPKSKNGFFLSEEQMRQLSTQRLLAYKTAHLINTRGWWEYNFDDSTTYNTAFDEARAACLKILAEREHIEPKPEKSAHKSGIPTKKARRGRKRVRA